MNTNDLHHADKVSKTSVALLLVATLATVSDGYNLAVMGYVAPELIHGWHVTANSLVPVFLAGVLGLIVGAPCLGYFGDRFGRPSAIIVAHCSFGAVTFLMAFAANIQQLVGLRFLAGLGLGGLIPNTIALAAENGPKRLRGMFIIIVNFGIPAGFALPGLTAAVFMVPFGWPMLFFVGSILPLVTAAIIARLMHNTPSLPLPAAAHKASIDMVVPTERRPGTLARLYAGSLGVITPAIWIALALDQFTNFFALSWLPTLLQAAGLSAVQTEIDTSMFSIGGMAGGVSLMLVIDRLGVLPITALFIAGAPLLLAIGHTQLPPAVLAGVMAGAGFCVIGINFGLSAAIGMVYPIDVRSAGAGYAQAFGRLGALAAQVVGGALLSRHVPTQEIFLIPAIALALGSLASLVALILCVRRFHGFQLHDYPVGNAIMAVNPATKF